MKLHVLLTAAVLTLGMTACASETITHDAAELPEKAHNIITQNFSSAISVIKVEKSMGKVKEYEVTLTDGSVIEFNGDCEWESVMTPPNIPVPEGLVPTNIAKFVAEKHAGTFIDGIERDKKGFEVDLSNQVEIHFDPSGNFISYDK